MKERLMDEARHCAQCGAVLSVYALEGVCGNCLLQPGLEPMGELDDKPADEMRFPALGTGPKSGSRAEGLGRFGDYELLEEISRGGMGIVYRARQVSLGRIVAVKMLLAGPLATKDFVQRFRTESAAAASLQHPNIVAIHEVGFAQGQHFFAMDFVEGLTLAQLVAKGPLPARHAATYLKTIAEAIQFAHERNVLHRDLKPSNVLIESATNQPRVTDFGLAKRLTSTQDSRGAPERANAAAAGLQTQDLTLTGQLLGSPNYMSPEQATAKRGTVGKRSDVYSLGAILYHLLTGRPPFQGETLTDVLRQLADDDPLAPHLLTPQFRTTSKPFASSVWKKGPVKRYQSAQELADELDRFLRDEPIHAHPVTGVERMWRWCRRKPALAGLIVALHLVLALGLVGVLWAWRGAKVSESVTRENLYTADMNLAHQAWKEGSLRHAEELLAAHGKEDLRGFEWRYLSQLCRDESRVIFTNVKFASGLDHAGGRQGLALAADGQTVIAASGNTLKWLDWQKPLDVLSRIAGPEAISRLSMARDQPGLVAYRTDRVRALSPTGEALLGAGLTPDFDGAIALSWDGALLAGAGTNNTVRIFDVKSGQQLGPDFDLGEDESVLSLAFSPDAKYLACGSIGNKIHILGAPRLKSVRVLTNHTAFVTCLAFDRDGKKLASGCNDSHIRVWSFPDCSPPADLTGHQGLIGDLAFSPDGLRLASGGSDHTVRLWNLASTRAPTLLHGHRGAVSSVLFSRDGNQLFTGSDDQTVKVWDVSARESTNLLRHSGYTADVDFSPDGALIAVADYTARTAVLWQLPGQRRIEPVGKHSESCTGVMFSPDGKLLATVGGDTNVQVWEVSSSKKKFDFPTADTYGSLAFHPRKHLLAVGGEDLRFMDSQNGAQMYPLAGAPTNGVRSVVFSMKGMWLALGMRDGQVSIWDFVTGRLSCSFHNHSREINALCFSHDGNLLASGGDDHRVVLYEVRQRRMIALLDGHTLGVYGLAFAPDDKTLVSTSMDGTIRFWSMANHQVALTLAHDGGPVTSVKFSPDGNFMATSGSDGTVRLWPAAKFDDVITSKKPEADRK